MELPAGEVCELCDLFRKGQEGSFLDVVTMLVWLFTGAFETPVPQ